MELEVSKLRLPVSFCVPFSSIIGPLVSLRLW